jgi:hypothetical protein
MAALYGEPARGSVDHDELMEVGRGDMHLSCRIARRVIEKVEYG